MDSMHVVQRNKTRVTGDPMLDGAYDPDDDDNVFSASTFPWTLVDMADDNNRASCNNGTNMSPSFCAPNANNVDTDTDNSGTSGSTVSTTGTNGIFDSQNQTATKTGKDKESNSPSTSSFRYDRWTYRGPLVSKQKLSEKVKETLEDTDRLIAKELSEMSIKERDLVLSDLHGLKREDDNTTRELQNSTLVRDALKQLDYEISKLKKHRQAYDKALFLNPSYVMNQTFRLKFLRADRFNTVKAARRLIQHFDFKLELFGIEKLARDITFDDLNDDEQEIYLAGGFWPVHNAYDRTGRRIVLAMLDRFIFKHPNNNFRVMWYVLMSALDDLQTQKNGMVCLYFSLAKTDLKKAYNAEFLFKSNRVYECIPFWFVGLHLCFEKDTLQTKLPNPIAIMQIAIGTQCRVRSRTHVGTPIEIIYELISYGIPTQVLPIDSMGNMDESKFVEYVKIRRAYEEARRAYQESSSVSKNIVYHPNRNDVLLGRGRPYQDFPGNTFLAQTVNIYKEQHDGGLRHDKTALAMKIVKEIHNRGGRFLRKRRCQTNQNRKQREERDSGDDSDGYEGKNNNDDSNDHDDGDNYNDDGVFGEWEEVDYRVAHRKVSTAFQTWKRMKWAKDGNAKQ